MKEETRAIVWFVAVCAFVAYCVTVIVGAHRAV